MFTKPIWLLVSVLCLHSCRKGDTQPEPTLPPSVQNWKSDMMTLPKTISASNEWGGTARYRLNFDSVLNVMELMEIYDDHDPIVRIINKYNSEGYLIEQNHRFRGYGKGITTSIDRDADNKIRWLSKSPKSVVNNQDSLYVSYHKTGSETVVTELIPTGWQISSPSSNWHDSLFTTYDQFNKVIRRQWGQNSSGEIQDYFSNSYYDANGRLTAAIDSIRRYHPEEFPNTAFDSAVHKVELVYTSNPPATALPKSFDQITYGADHYLFSPRAQVNLFVYPLFSLLRPPSIPIAFPIPDHLPLHDRPSEYHYYTSRQDLDQDPPVYINYTENSNGNLAKIEMKVSGKAVLNFEFGY